MKYIIDAAGNLVTSIFGIGRNIPKNHKHYKKLVKAMENDDYETFLKYSDQSELIEGWSCGHFKVKDGVVLYKDTQIAGAIQDHLESLVEEEADYRPFLLFMNKVYQKDPNLSDELFLLRVDSLWRWLTTQKLHLNTNGNFLAYKYVRVHTGEEITDKMGNVIKEGDFVDAHTRRSFRNNVGDSPRMSIGSVCTSTSICAGAGLHVGNKSYVSGNPHVVIVEVDPRDVVVVPSSQTCKIRTTGYKVVEKFTGYLGPHTPYSGITGIPYEDDHYDDEDDDWGED
jgi:hypothetical protein